MQKRKMKTASHTYGVSSPFGPKYAINASTIPKTYIAADATFAKKNIRPMAPPNSGPRARLIITVFHLDKEQ